MNMTLGKKRIVSVAVMIALIITAIAPMLPSNNLYATSAPKTPKAVKAVSKNDYSATFKWKKSSGADGYEVFMAKGKGSYNLIKTTSKTKLTQKNLKAKTKYKFIVKAYKWDSGTKLYSGYSKSKAVKTKKAKIRNIKGLKATAQTKAVKLSWKKDKKAKGYIVYMATEKTGKYKKIAKVKKKTVTYTKKGLTAGKTYFFKVKEYKKVKGKTYKSNSSKIVSATPKNSGNDGGGEKPDDNPGHNPDEDSKRDDYYYHSEPEYDESGGVAGMRHGIHIEGGYANYYFVSSWAYTDGMWGSIPTQKITINRPDVTVMYTLDGTTPSLSNGTKVTYSESGLFVHMDKRTPTIKTRAYVNGKQVALIEFTNVNLLYWDILTPKQKLSCPGLTDDGYIHGTEPY